MATIENLYTGDGSTVLFSFTFEYIEEVDVEVSIDSVTIATTEYSLANSTTIEFNTAPTSGSEVRIYRNTTVDTPKATFFPGSAIRAQDLNDNFEQILFVTQEADAISERAEEAADQAQIATTAALAASDAATASATAAQSAATQAQSQVSAAQAAAADAAADAATAVSTADSAVATADAAELAADQAELDAAQAAADANSAQSSATSAGTSAASASGDAFSAQQDASQAADSAATASSTATSALNTANTAATNALSAVSTASNAETLANSAVTTANSASSLATTANSNATSAVSTANTASSAAASAVASAATAVSDASTAVSTANAADATANSAETTANSADSKADTAISAANSAVTTANDAETKADAAVSAVSDAYLFTVVANVAAIPSSPSEGDAVRVADSTGVQNVSGIQSVPSGFVGDSGINAEIIFTSGNWVFLEYTANDPDDRYGYPPFVDVTRQNTVDAATLSGVALNDTDLGTFTGSTINDGQTIKGALQDLETGKADLVAGKVPTSQIPALGITEFLGTVTSESALLALSGQRGDWAIRTDLGKNYVLIADGGSSLSDWVQLVTPAVPVDSVNSQTGVVVLGPNDVGALATTGGTMSGDITFNAGQAFDGRDVSADGAKLDGIESSATADQTDAEIRAAVEAATDSNVLTDALKTKLDGIATGAEVNAVTSVNGSTGAVTVSVPTNNNQLTNGAGFITAAQVPASFVTGMILMFTGTSAPSGWALCNGSNGTPDLRDRFIVGYGSSYSIGNTGGSSDAIVVSHNHGTSESAHSHGINQNAHSHGTTQSAHSHGGSVGSHSHSIGVRNATASGNDTAGDKVRRGKNSSNLGSSNINTSSSGANLSVNNANIGINVNSANISIGMNGATTGLSINSEGSSGSGKNLPPYYALAFIMKL